ncbi:MAG: transglutaminase-like domain-containing protein [Nitrospirae bacterium]|nr:transglutaminase-like domain-containing protein [Nitrospirota bacterium]MCL5422704.1 transglutaminase-like domain-containing protein [Nitrospirota bacterium]
MSRTLKIVNIAVFIIWIALLSLLLYRQYAGTPLGKQEALKGISKLTHWYDIYAGPKKVGFARYTFEWVGDEIIIRYEQEVKIKQGDREKFLIESYRCLSNSNYAIKSFEYSSHYKDEKGIKVTGEVDADAVVFFLESPEKRKTFRTSTKGKDIYLSTTFIPAIIQKNPSPHSVFTVPMLDFINLSIDDMRVVVEEIRPMKLGIQVVSYYKMRVGNQIFWSNEKGITVKEEYPGGLTLYSQTEALAKDPTDRILFDSISLPFLRSNKIVKDAESLKLLKVRINGFPLDAGLYDKSLVTLQNDTLFIRKEDPEEFKKKSYLLPCKDQAVRRYLQPDEWVLSDNRTVKGNALNMAAVEKNDAFRLARYLNSNLYFTVKTMPLFVLTNSLDTFASHVGDHLQRTVMFASFARAAGLPVRLVGGLVYRDGYFYFHTWPEAWFGKWIPMDPTLAQFPADVTHIPLREGSVKDITSLVNELKSLDIEVLEAS